MKRGIILVTLIAFLVTKSFGQKIDLFWGPENKAPGRTVVDGVIGKYKDDYFILRKKISFSPKKQKLTLEKYNSKNELVFTKPLPMPGEKNTVAKAEGIFIVKDEIILISSYFNKKQGKNYAFASKIDMDGNAKGDFVKIDEIETDSKRHQGSYNISVSNDSTKFLILREDPYENSDNQIFHFKVLDIGFKELWAKDLELPYKYEDYFLDAFKLANNGTVYMLAAFVLKDKESRKEARQDKKEGKPTYKYLVDAYSPESDKLKEFEISLGDLFISDIGFTLDSADNINCAGFYSKKSSSGVAGCFYVKVDSKDLKVISKSTKEFSTDFLANFMSERKAEKGRELEGFYLRKLVKRNDGGLAVVAEKYYVTTSQSCDNHGHCTTNYHYHYDEIFILNINPDGNIGWTSVVPKKQISENDGGVYSSFALMSYGSKLYFIYNDNRKNIDVFDSRKLKYMTNVKQSQAIIAVVDEKGKVTKNVLINNKDNKTYVVPKKTYQMKKDQMIFYAQKGKKYKFGTIIFK